MEKCVGVLHSISDELPLVSCARAYLRKGFFGGGVKRPSRMALVGKITSFCDIQKQLDAWYEKYRTLPKFLKMNHDQFEKYKDLLGGNQPIYSGRGLLHTLGFNGITILRQ